MCVFVHAPALVCIDFPFHFYGVSVFFHLCLDIFSTFALMENAILSYPFTFLLLRPFFFFILFLSLTYRKSVSLFVWEEMKMILWREKKKNGDVREGVGDKKWQGIENQWEMKYIRAPGARSRGYDLSQHTVVPHWARGSCEMEREQGSNKGEKTGGRGGPGKWNRDACQDRQTPFLKWSHCLVDHKQHPLWGTSSGHKVCCCCRSTVRAKTWTWTRTSICLRSTLPPHWLKDEQVVCPPQVLLLYSPMIRAPAEKRTRQHLPSANIQLIKEPLVLRLGPHRARQFVRLCLFLQISPAFVFSRT